MQEFPAAPTTSLAPSAGVSTLVEALAKLLGATVGFWRVELNLNNGKLVEIRRHHRTPARAVDDRFREA